MSDSIAELGTAPEQSPPAPFTGAAPAATPPTAIPPLDVQPILVRRPESIWARAEQARDTLYTALEQACETAGVKALVIKSGPFEQPAWVKLECWIPHGRREITKRGWVQVMIEAKEFHRYELEYRVEMHNQGWLKAYHRLRDFGPTHASHLAKFLLGQGRKPKFAALQIREEPLQIWKRKNKVKVLGIDWLGMIPVAVAMFGFSAIASVPWLGLLFLLLGLLFLLGSAVASSQLRRRRFVVKSSGKPEAEPRTLHLVDYWQTLIAELGNDAEELRKEFFILLDSPPMEGFKWWVEKIWDWGLDGKIEREQIVLTLRRGMVFCQIYQYDRELYLGWDAHLNSGQWVEETVATGIDKETGMLTKVNTVHPGWQRLSEYDITDLNCLIEWTHSKLTQLVKRLMEERKIDQEIDFKILRGARQNLTNLERPNQPVETVRQSGHRLLRTG